MKETSDSLQPSLKHKRRFQANIMAPEILQYSQNYYNEDQFVQGLGESMSPGPHMLVDHELKGHRPTENTVVCDLHMLAQIHSLSSVEALAL